MATIPYKASKNAKLFHKTLAKKISHQEVISYIIRLFKDCAFNEYFLPGILNEYRAIILEIAVRFRF